MKFVRPLILQTKKSRPQQFFHQTSPGELAACLEHLFSTLGSVHPKAAAGRLLEEWALRSAGVTSCCGEGALERLLQAVRDEEVKVKEVNAERRRKRSRDEEHVEEEDEDEG